MQLTIKDESSPIGSFFTLCPPPKPEPNTKLILNGNTRGMETGIDTVEIVLYRIKPLNRFQRWMYKTCFGIKAENI